MPPKLADWARQSDRQIAVAKNILGISEKGLFGRLPGIDHHRDVVSLEQNSSDRSKRSKHRTPYSPLHDIALKFCIPVGLQLDLHKLHKIIPAGNILRSSLFQMYPLCVI